MSDDDLHDPDDPGPRGSRRPYGGRRARGRRGPFDAGLLDGLLDLDRVDRVLRDLAAWFDDESAAPGRRASAGRARRHGPSPGSRTGDFADTGPDEAFGAGGRVVGDTGRDADDGYDDEDATRSGSLRGRGPRNYRRSDERTTELVNDALYDDEALDASDIEVSVSDAEITLAGHVASRRDKHRAENLAARAAGVRDVDNRLRVRGDGEAADGRRTGGSTGGSAGGTPSGGAPNDAEQDADDYGHP